MSESRRCPQCGAELPANAPDAPCPACLIKLGLQSWADRAGGGPAEDAAATEGIPGRFQPPDAEELAGHFPQLEILELLGVGGMGAVYKARQPGLDRIVALKILPPEVGRDPAFAERFAREARAMARLSHPNIVAIHDSGQASEFYYFVMEFVEGVNLRQTFDTGGLTPQEVLAVVPQICDALQYAHNEGIVHRDIKPENVLLDKRGRVKIADFGLAKLLGKAPAEFTLTGTGQVMGTLHYMAPEQMERPQQVDHRADIYSLGVVFYEMLTGELPIGRFAPPSKKVQVDVRLDEVVLRALEKDPDQRYQKVSEVKTDVESAGRGRGRKKPPPAATLPPLHFRMPFVFLAVMFYAVWFSAIAGLGLSPVLAWILVVLFLVVPSAMMALHLRDTKLGSYARLCALAFAAMAVCWPLYSGLAAFRADPQPMLDWLYRTTGVTPGRHDVAIVRGLFTVGAALLLLFFFYGWWVVGRRLQARWRGKRSSQEEEGVNPSSGISTPARRKP